MAEVGGKRPRNTPMECWGCKGDHRYRDYLQKSDKVRAIHNVHQEKIVEDMGRRVLIIYVDLDNKQVEFQSHMIEFQGMIDNYALTILIDLGASHSYVDPKVVQRFQLPRIKHGKSWLVQLAIGTKRKVVELVKSLIRIIFGTK
jgi:hypothetical protein